MSARQNFLIFISNGSAETADTVAEGEVWGRGREGEVQAAQNENVAQASAEAENMAAVVLKSSAYVIELLTELAFGQQLAC